MLGISTRIDAVTVYRRGARIRRVAELAREAGFPAVIRLGGLPLGLDDSSVRVSLTPRLRAADGAALGENGGGPLPIASDVRVALDVPDADPTLRPADDVALETARHQVRQLEARGRLIEREIARLDAMALPARPGGAEGEPPRESPTAARLALVGFRGQREQALRDELRALRRELDAAARKREQLEDQNRRATTARQARQHELRKAVVVTLRDRDAAAPRVRLVLEYLIPGACWAPTYVVHFDGALAHARLGLRALVAQRSGEDWNGVALTLSTAEADRWTELPELPSRRIGRKQPVRAKLGWRPPPAGAEDLYRDWDRAFRGRFPATIEVRGAAAIAADEESKRAETTLENMYAPEAGEFLDDVPTRTAPAPHGMPVPKSAPPPRMAPPPGAPPMAGAPPMQAQSLPPEYMLAPASRSKSANAAGAALMVAAAPVALAAKGLGALFGGGGREEARAPDEGGGYPGSVTVEPEPGAPIGAGDPLLRYGELRMPPARAHGRGRLTIAARQELYLALLLEQKITIGFDAVAVVDLAERQAGVIGPLPPGAELAWSDRYDHAYAAGAPVDVPADGEFHSVPLLERDAAARALYVVVPRESTDVFRTAAIDNPLEAPLLPGPVDIYVRGDFLMTGRLPATAQGGTVALGLGVDQGIKVARNARFREESAGLMGGKLSLHHQLVVEVRNNLDRPARIEVRERLPVLREGEEDIEVAEAAVSPAWEEWKQEPESAGEAELEGGRRWLVTVPAGGREELRAEYEIRIASKHELVGGNRREV